MFTAATALGKYVGRALVPAESSTATGDGPLRVDSDDEFPIAFGLQDAGHGCRPPHGTAVGAEPSAGRKDGATSSCGNKLLFGHTARAADGPLHTATEVADRSTARKFLGAILTSGQAAPAAAIPSSRAPTPRSTRCCGQLAAERGSSSSCAEILCGGSLNRVSPPSHLRQRPVTSPSPDKPTRHKGTQSTTSSQDELRSPSQTPKGFPSPEPPDCVLLVPLRREGWGSNWEILTPTLF